MSVNHMSAIIFQLLNIGGTTETSVLFFRTDVFLFYGGILNGNETKIQSARS